MAKVKQYAVEIEYTVTKTVYVTARRPGGAEKHALTDEGWAEAHRYGGEECDSCGTGAYVGRLPKDARVMRVREV